jgi:site-specific DNA-methyltransferase (adenine-specific)
MKENSNKLQLYNADCLEILKTIPNGSIDLIITDPPYKMNHTTGGHTNIGMKNRWQGNIKAGNSVMGFKIDIKFQDWLPEVYRVLKNSGHCYIFCNDKNVQELLNEAIHVGFRESNILVWVKNNACPNRYYMKNCEFILFLYKGAAKPITDMSSKAAFAYDNINGKNKHHPTEKPVGILKSFIANSSNYDDIVLDPFMGSGSTGVACAETNRRFIGIEIDEKYFDTAKHRINNTEIVKDEPNNIKHDLFKKLFETK